MVKKYILERKQGEAGKLGNSSSFGQGNKVQKNTVLNICFPDEFHENSVIVEQGF